MHSTLKYPKTQAIYLHIKTTHTTHLQELVDVGLGGHVGLAGVKVHFRTVDVGVEVDVEDVNCWIGCLGAASVGLRGLKRVYANRGSGGK